jgi:subtilisin family serine protease
MKAIEMETVWDNFTGSNTVCVAVFDTGIDYNHPDINANMARDSFNYNSRNNSHNKTQPA